MNKIKEYIKSHDYFGYVFNVTFGKNGDPNHNTFLGGIISFAFNIIIL